MTPKEKAKELVHTYEKWTLSEYACECALIAVEEILDNRGVPFYFEDNYKYWQEVKQEINKL